MRYVIFNKSKYLERLNIMAFKADKLDWYFWVFY